MKDNIFVGCTADAEQQPMRLCYDGKKHLKPPEKSGDCKKNDVEVCLGGAGSQGEQGKKPYA